MRAGADANGGDGQGFADALRGGPGNRFNHDRKRARVLQRTGVFDQMRRALGGFALHLVRPQQLNRLRPQSDMAHHRDARLHQPFDGLRLAAPAFEFDRVGAAFLQQARGVFHGVVDRNLVGQKRQVGDNHRALNAALDCAGVIDDVVKRHRDGGIAALDDHAQRVSHQNGVDAGIVH